MNTSKSILVSITAVATSLDGPWAHEAVGDATGALLRWTHIEGEKPICVIATGRLEAMRRMRPGDAVLLTGMARLIEALPILPTTLLMDVSALQVIAPAHQRGEPA